MKASRSAIAFAAAALLCGCNPGVTHKCIAPLPAGIELGGLEDCTVPASFTSDDFLWMGGNLRMKVYNRDLYDAVEVSQLAAGDTLIYDSEPLVIESIGEADGGIVINGGLENDGCLLVGNGGGTYVARIWNDHATYTELGTAEVALAEDFVLIDCAPDPSDPADTIRTGQKIYIETLEGSLRVFCPLNTDVRIEGGMVTEINRRYIP